MLSFPSIEILNNWLNFDELIIKGLFYLDLLLKKLAIGFQMSKGARVMAALSDYASGPSRATLKIKKKHDFEIY